VKPQLEKQLRFCKTLPTIPAIAMHVIDLAGQPEGNISDIARLIGHDPALTLKVLKVANSPLYGFRRKTDNLRQALNMLGLNAVITLALSFSLTGALREVKQGGFNTEYYWRRSAIAAAASRCLGTQLGIKRDEELMLAGLLQDVGMLVLSSVFQEDYGKAIAGTTDHDAVIKAEQLAFGADHAEVGAWQLSQWNLPKYLQQIVVASHEFNSTIIPSDASAMSNCIVLSGLIADGMLHPNNEYHAVRAAKCAEEILGLDTITYRAVLDLISAILPDISDIFDIKMIDLSQAVALKDQANELIMMRHLHMNEEVKQVRRTAEELSARSRLLEDQMKKDSLTGLFNRSHFDEILLKEFSLATEQGWPLSVAFIDLDNFKQINDNFGHKVGDEVLQSIANVMLRHTRQSDLLARYGGEEFVVILPGTDAAGARKLIERLMEAVRNFEHDVHPDESIHATISIGLATHLDEGYRFNSSSDLLQAADDAMYAAKKAGRNRLVVYSDIQHGL
jgi:diguanylate cyclase (GGDEF)-like protein